MIRLFKRGLTRVLLLGSAAAVIALGGVSVGLNAAGAGVETPTYNKDVASILNEKCASCHRPGAGGPMSLTSYAEVRPWARAIKTRVTKREMPPWSADQRFGHFKADSSLSDAQIETIAKWVDGGMLMGDGAAPPMPKFAEGGWRIINGRPPDVILEMPMTYELPAEGQIPVFRIWDKNPFKEDVFVEALQILPSNTAVTHHSALYGRKLPEGTTLKKGIGWRNSPELAYIPTYPDGSITNLLTADGGTIRGENKPGDRVPVISPIRDVTEQDDERLMFYLPGADYQVFPPGSAKRIRASNALMWELHYSPDGKVETDIERIGLWLAKSTPQHEVHVIRNGSAQHIIENQEVGSTRYLPPIPAGAADWKITAIQAFTENVTISSMQPHMHLRGKDMTYVAKYPDGHEEVLLSVPKYDFNWQNTYMPLNPIRLPAGTVLETVGHYDNSVRNKVNPAPQRPALWSEQTWDEMYNAWTELIYDKEVATGSGTISLDTKTPMAAVVGCVVPGSSHMVWNMTNATRFATDTKGYREGLSTGAANGRRNGTPVVEDKPIEHNVTAADKEKAAALKDGKERIELVGVADFVTPEEALKFDTRKALYPIERVNSTGALKAGRRVAAKGIWIPGATNRLNLTSVAVLDESCGATGTSAGH